MIDLKKILNEDQDPKAVEKLVDKLSSYLLTGEEVLFMAVQKKPAVNLLPDSVALTTKRVIFCRPKNLGLSLDFEDYYWKNISECRIKEGILGSEYIVIGSLGEANAIDYIPKVQARRLHATSQEQLEICRHPEKEVLPAEKISLSGVEDAVIVEDEQALEEPISHPLLEDTHDISLSESAIENISVSEPADEITATLQKLRKLYESGLITQNEYEAKKREVLSRL